MKRVLDCGCVLPHEGARIWCDTCLDSDSPLATPLSLRGAQLEIAKWADRVFPDRTVKGSLAKLMVDEIPEMRAALNDPLEYADVLIMVLDLSYQMGIDIEKAFREKMAINKARTWKRDPDTGFYNHVKATNEDQ
jgi:NTP pyrophosphatase (non-canonical NTP hydrolase)